MATYKLDRTKTQTWEITTTGDTWVLGEKGRIASDTIADGIHAADTITRATIRIDGEIDLGAVGAVGVDIYSHRADISVGETGHIMADGSAISYDNSDGAVTISNKGLLEAAADSCIFVGAKQDSALIRNDGHIHSEDSGILSEGAGASIINSGVIRAPDGIIARNGNLDDLPLDADNATHITNSGRIDGIYRSIGAFGVAVNLCNTGTLNGDVSLINGDDVVDNRGGTVNGDVWLYEGDDRFDGRGGRLNGVLYGGDGNDIVTLASPATLYVELANEGADKVRINATYRLGANVEDLQLLGKASHTGIGNSLSNWIYGNKGDNALYGLDGNDMLTGGEGRDRLDGGDGNDALYGHRGRDMMTGGAGADYFGFYAGNGRDTITDFEIGIDVIGLQGIDGIAGFADLDGRIVQSETNPSDTIIRLGDTDMLILRDTIAANLTANDFDFH